MKYDYIMVRYGELSTKGKNKKDFINTLARNIRNALSNFSNLNYIVRLDHIYIELNDNNPEEIIDILSAVSGIHAMSLVVKIDDNIENIKNTALDIVKESEGNTFKVHTRRANKKYPIVSDQVNREVAGHILRNTNLKVDVHNPDILISIEIREDGCYLFTKTYEGSGGYPLGVGGKILHMLSGGIDSPVAAYLLMKRGIRIECIHFASPPYTNIGVIEKLKDLLAKLNVYQDKIRLNIVPFTKIQEKIYEVSDESYAITLMRRAMFRIATKLALKRHISAISSGESVGQVASQTLESMNVINEVTNLPILRPLVAYDKLDIIKLANKIDTYEISIRPYEDCCTIFAPKNPKTKPSLEKAKEYESKYDFDSLIEEAINNIEAIYISKE